MKTFIALLTIIAAAMFYSPVMASQKIITFSPAAVTTDAQPLTCDTTQAGYSFTVSMINTPASCIPQNVFLTTGSLTAGKTGVYAAYSAKAPAGVTFSLKAFILKRVIVAKGYPAVYLSTVDSLGNYQSYSLKLNPLGVYDVSALALDNLTEFYIQARTASYLELTNISIVDSL